MLEQGREKILQIARKDIIEAEEMESKGCTVKQIAKEKLAKRGYDRQPLVVLFSN